MTALSAFILAAIATVAKAQSLTVVNSCSESVFLYTQTSYGSVANNINVSSGRSANLGISSNWDGAINIGTGCNGGSCTTGGSTWNGKTPFSRAEFNFWANPGRVTYDISLIYGYNVGMKISSADSSCDAFACTISSGCPVPGPGSDTCYSPCCSSASACSGGALPAGGGGCVNNEGPGPNSKFYYDTCPNAYAFPDNDGSNGYTPANNVVYTCDNTDITLTLCPGTTSHIGK
ncbi:Osmotin thaumatin-like protein [Suillus paluster]|uniref:Osmotin thaumatin-like protein n=1 Tax=Suillus paluster TaxID=48578 RepID=UPI001B87C462|nr:Osmotin thaumatin-like protein [Suillus paluster]XP_041182843.1 Osmotin thaumatin-like protein [Suillus paluster]KAG1717533.1 Osmotin thaumatin-like protein [Suillus paluster]KAG1753511.1 Osmotin thaumatin-like protein [Suillus paluster]